MKNTIKTILTLCVLFGTGTLTAKESSLPELTNKNYTKTIKNKAPVVVKFWAPWCGACKKIGPNYIKSSKTFKGKVKFTSVNVDDYYDLAVSKGIKSVPTLIIYKNGKEMGRTSGSKSKSEIDAWVKKYKI